MKNFPELTSRGFIEIDYNTELKIFLQYVLKINFVLENVMLF